MGRRSVAEAMRPIKDRVVALSSSAAGPVTKQMVAEASDTLIQEKHPASPPEWPKDTGTPAQGDRSWPGETGRRTSKAGGRSHTTQWHGPLPTRMGTRKD